MGIRIWIFVLLRPPYHGGKDGLGRPGSKEKEIEFEIPEFPKPRRASAAVW